MVRKSCDRCGKDMGVIKQFAPFSAAYFDCASINTDKVDNSDPMRIVNIWAGPNAEQLQMLDLCENCTIGLREFLGIQRRSLNNE